MKIRLQALILLLTGIFPSLSAQDTNAERLFEKFKAASAFDYKYPREKVYLHLDNSAYLENDTLWYKAYVVRASSMRPSALSQVLYVELLNADGQLMEKQTLKLDAAGQADGCFDLKLPYRAGYYEIRAYTREMTNWGEAACFSRFFPLFGAANPQERLEKKLDTGMKDLFIPEPTANKHVTLGTPRPYLMTDDRCRQLTFYPEGGNRAKNLEQRIAFKLTDGKGRATKDTVQIFFDDGTPLAQAVPEHEGMGSFMLPSNFAGGYAQVSGPNLKGEVLKVKYPLPQPAEAYTLQAQSIAEGLLVCIAANDSAAARHELLGLAAFNHERTCYFDTLTCSTEPVEILIPRQALRLGVNRLELFDGQGRSRATRLVWAKTDNAGQHRIKVNLQQNETAYKPFSPAVLKMDLKDDDGNPVQTTFSIAVRDREGNLVASDDSGIETDLLLSSEVKGYIHQPENYFKNDDAVHRRRLDLLLMVQGWTANTFDTMCGTDTFKLKQPIEQKLILRGTLYKDNDKFVPQPFMLLDMKAYSRSGSAIEGNTQTDKDGKFAFESEIDFSGDLIAQFISRNDKGKRKWGRLTLDRWFAPQPRPIWGPELTLREPSQPSPSATGSSHGSQPQTFVWEDTIPNRRPTLLGEATVNTKGKYGGFTGNRYSWKGGEKYGMSLAMKYYNFEQEVERLKDMGLAPGDFNDVISRLESNYEFERFGDVGTDFLTINGGGTAKGGTHGTSDAPDFNAASPFGDASLKPTMTYRGRSMKVYLNNEPYADLVNRYPELYSSIQAEEIKSVSIVADNSATNAVNGKATRNSKTSYKMYIYELPAQFRFKDQKGIERRRIQGFTPRKHFYAPDYRRFDVPSARDVRRTLHWAPSVQTDENGHADLIFYTNSRPGQQLDISIRGITLDGRCIDYDSPCNRP